MMQKMIIGAYLVLSGLMAYKAEAQITESTLDSQGNETRFMIFQVGKDTTVIGVPFNAADKLGMTIEVYKRPRETQNVFFFALRTDNPEINSLPTLEHAQLLFAMSNADTVRIPVSDIRIFEKNKKNEKVVNLQFHFPITNQQLNTLGTQSLSKLLFCIKPGADYIELPINDEDGKKLKRGLSYVIK